LPLLLLAQGKTDNARTLITRALGGLELALDRAKLLPAHINISLAARDIESAQASVAELESSAGRYGSVALRAAATEARGNLNLANGDFADASTNLQRALALWLEIELPYEAAVTRTLLAQAFRGLGDEASAELEAHAARTTFAKLGAHSAFKTQTIVGIN
jgi:hypothetical protein